MRARSGAIQWILGLSLCSPIGFTLDASAQQGEAVRLPQASSCASSVGAVTVHAPRAGSASLSLCEGRALGGNLAQLSQRRALTLASGDFDEDGTPDLVSGFATGKGGQITVHRGNVAALWPYGAALRNGPPSPFFSNPRIFTLPEAPDFVLTGDFDADGHWDILTARRGSSYLIFLRGDGHGGFQAAKAISIPGAVTALISGEINRADGLPDIVVGVTTPGGSRALVYESPLGAIRSQPEVFNLPQPATALALGRFDGEAMNDLAVAVGSDLVVIHARDRMLTHDEEQHKAVSAARVTVQQLSYKVTALAAGDFTGAGPAIAALEESGTVHILEHTVAEDSLFARMASPDFKPTMQLAPGGKDKKPLSLSGRPMARQAARMAAVRELLRANSDSSEWTERSTVSLPSGFAQSVSRLVAARVSGSPEEDVIAVDSGNRQVHVLSTASKGRKSLSAEAIRGNGSSTLAPMKLMASLEAESAPVAVLPMRLSKHGLNGLVMLHEGESAPTVMPQDVPPANIFTVTNTSDGVIVDGINKTGPAGSLRKAIFDANHATGTSTIVFNIPTTDPGYNATTGTFRIQPLSESVPNAFDNFALPPINATILIDGYTQPGASPNTLANGDNAKILIQIDGSKATTPGGAGLVPFDDVGSVFRGLDFTGWTNAAISNNTASGAEGIEANGVADFIEGNFFGTDPTGKVAAPNRIGVFADNGPGFGNTSGGNIIGGTTPQARNILSGNNNSGILFLSTAIEAQLQGNFVGLDITGAATVSNTLDGVGLNGPTVTIGGTLPGTANVIAGNGTNVDINDLTEGGAASNSRVQGNLIGTDATGAHAIAHQGYGVSILHNPKNMTIGGTTSSGRNVISGNLAGVYIFDNSFYNIVQGNFIGTDITGAKAVPNVTQGFITGATASTAIPAGYTTIGGSVAGAGNVISGNTQDGIEITGTSQSTGYPYPEIGNTILGNLIGTDVTGAKTIANGGNGVFLSTNATNNIIGGSNPGSGNLIANNKGNGVLIDPASTTAGIGVGNNTIANAILSNGGAGVRVKSGSSNRISQNSIFANKALGIDIDTAGPNLNSHCNATNNGANGLQNAPVLTSGAGSLFITATATDPSGNTSEFSNAVKSSTNGSVISLLGNFDSKPSTAYTIEFFSSTADDASGFGQGQTYLGSTSVSTDADCTIAINDPVDTIKADVSVTLSSPVTSFQVGPDFGSYTLVGHVANLGPATAHNVVFTDTLPAGLEISSAYCNVGPCQTPATTTLGNCTVVGNKITCNLGTLPPGATSQVTIPVQATTSGSLVDSATVAATESDPVLANNSATLTPNSTYPFPFIDHVDPTSAVTITSGSLPLTVYGNGFLPTTAITFNGTAVATTGYLDNQVCGGPFSPGFCSAIQVSVPASLLGTAGTYTVTATNPDPGPGGGSNFPSSASFTLVASCTYNPQFFGFNPVDAEGDTLIPESIEVSTNAPTCPWTATSNASWLVILDNAKGTGNGSLDVAVAPNPGAARSGTVTVAGKTVEIDQSAGDSSTCTYGFSPTSAHIPAGGISSSFAVTTASGCSYFVEPYPQDSSYVTGVQFIAIPQSSGLLVGNGNPSYTVAPNHGAPRTGAIMVGGDVFTITQDAPACYYTLSSTGVTEQASGGTGTIKVTPSSSSCAWTAKSSDTKHLVVSSGASGTGNGTVKYTALANTDGPQTPTLTIGDATGYSIFTVTQASAYTCTFTISPATRAVTSNGISNFFVINASYSFCKWTANSSDPTALAINGSGQGTGTGAIYYTVGKNSSTQARVLTIVAGCETFTVNQDGVAATNPVPVITTLQPASATAGSGAFTLTVNGSGFINGSTVSFNGVARVTTFVSANKLTAAILASDVATAGTPSVTVTNPALGGGTSNAVVFTVTGANNPAPAITSLQPTTAQAGSAAFTLTVNGTGFISSSVVNFNGIARTTTFVSVTKLTAAILASDMTTVGTPGVTVTNPAPGGGTSSAVTFTITAANNPAPAITSLQPATVQAGSAAFTLTVNGTGFVSTSVVNFRGTARATTFVSATQITAAILASDIATAGTAQVTVTNPAPGGGTSGAVNFTISAANNPAPAITILQPNGVRAGSAAFTLTINGTGFISTSTAKFNGTVKTTTFVSATKLTIPILASDVATAGSPTVAVTNPAPGGGTSNNVTFSVSVADNPAPTITTLQPATATAGTAAFTLTVNGTNFISSSVVNFNGIARATTYVSATQVTAAILATDIANASTVPVTVTNPAPGGGTSSAVNFTITAANNPAPVIASLQPASVTAGSASFSLTINGTGFVSTSMAKLNGSARATTFVSATQVTAAILATDILNAGTASITVTSPTPGGGTSTAVNLTITGTPQASLNPTALTFANTNVGTAMTSQDITLSNSGTGPLTISSIAVGGTNAGDFTATNTCGNSLAKNTSCAISVTFKPTAAGNRSATIAVTDNAAGSPHIATLAGVGAALPAPVVSLTPASLTFSAVAGTTTAAQTATLTNTGNAALSISSIKLTGTNSSAFAETNTCGSSLDVGANCTISITFTAPSAGSFTASLSVADNAAGTPHAVNLNGTGTPPPSFTLSTPTGTQTIVAGGAATYSIAVTAKNGTFNNAVTFAASGLPTGATATFAPPSVTPGSTSANTQLTIQTAAATSARAGFGSLFTLAPAALPLLGLFFLTRRQRRRWVTLALFAIAPLGAMATLSGCGGGFALPGSGAKNYTVTITGTSGQDQQTTTVQLTVK